MDNSTGPGTSFHRHRDVVSRTVRQSVILLIVAFVVAVLFSFVSFGLDPSRNVTAGEATLLLIVGALLVAGAIGPIMSYRSALALQRLALIRAELWRVSRTDQLTGLLNRRGFFETAASELERAQKNHIPAAALMCDVDYFKKINDRYGHDFGDAVLAEFGKLLAAQASSSGMIVGRHGGEEFAAVLFGSGAEQAMQTADTIRRACAAREILHGGMSTQITVSIGLASCASNPSLNALLRDADKALYKAKESGRNCVVLADASNGQLAA